MNGKIKGVFVFLLVTLLPLATGAAEKSGDRPFDIGVRLGAQISNVLTDAKWGPYPDISGPGGMLSFDAEIPVTEHFYIHPAIGIDNHNYFVYGEIGIPCASLEGEEPCGGSWEGYDVHSFFYLEVPVMAQWRTSALFLEAGPVIDILLHMHEEYILPEKYRSDRCYEDNRFGAGIAAGIGHVFGFGLSVDARVSFQFTDLVDGDKKCLTSTSLESEMWEEDGEIHTRVISSSSEYMGGSYYRLLKLQLGVGYWF